jgi:hypothetical protein
VLESPSGIPHRAFILPQSGESINFFDQEGRLSALPTLIVFAREKRVNSIRLEQGFALG